MAAQLDNVGFTPTLGGTTDWTYSSAISGYQSPIAANVISGLTYEVNARDLSGNWEISRGVCTVSAGVPTFARTTVLYNSAGTGTSPGQSGAGTKISFSGPPSVFVVLLKESLPPQKGHIWGLFTSAAGGVTSFGVGAGECADSTAVDLMTLGSAYTKTSASWAVGSGNGGLDTGTIAASTTYHFFLIKRPDTGVVDVLASLSPTAPTLPTNYTLFRRIGSVRTDASSHWLGFTQFNDEFLLLLRIESLGASVIAGTTAISVGLNVPTGIQVEAVMDVGLQGGTANAVGIIVSALDTTDQAPFGAGAGSFDGMLWAPTTTTGFANAVMRVRTNTSGQFRARASTATGSPVWAFYTVGWNDTRNRLG